MSNPRVEEFGAALRPSFDGEIHLDRYTRVLYSTDASIYQIEPLAVLFPRSHDDAAAAVATAARLGIPLLPRGGGTSLAGQTVGAAVVLDYSRHMNRVLEITPESESCRVEPGVVLDQLNSALAPHGWQFGPDVSTSNRATLGGMIGNNSCGSHSVLHGKTVDHVLGLRVLLATGADARLEALDAESWRRKGELAGPEGDVYRALDGIVAANADEIATRYPRVMRRVGGYNLDLLLPAAERNLSRLVAGSEGTLATYTEARLRIVRTPGAKALDVVHFDDMVAAMEAVPEILDLGPAAVELVDRMMLDLTRLQPGFARRMTFVEGAPEALLVVEFYGDDPAEVAAKLDRLDARLRRRGMGYAHVRAVTAAAQANVWAIRKAGLGLLSSVRGDSKPIAFVEDTAVAPDDLARYVDRFRQILARHETQAGFYGHASVGCLHIRPLVNLKSGSGVRTMTSLAGAVKDLVVEFKGAMSGEHGDGLVRSHWNRELFGDQLYEAFRAVKRAFDPTGIMNPGKIVDAPAMTDSLRYGEAYRAREISTHLDFRREGGMARAVEQCNGMGACRKVGTGTMCPSYMATRAEEHSTRGRANLLRAALSGQLPESEYTSERMHQALDLCLECKACKTECPANVDMAKLKYEFLAHYHRRHGTPLRARLFAHVAALARAGSALAPLSNRMLGSALFRRVLQPALGIAAGRRLPPFATTSFRGWLARHRPGIDRVRAADVVLFNDTFTNYHEPGIGRAALRLLESTGARVSIPDVVCCGRPMISKGLLEDARNSARRNVEALIPLVARGAVIVGCEPSCLLTLRDDYPDLVDSEHARQVAAAARLLEEYLVVESETHGWRAPSPPDTPPREVVVHGHCHQKSLVGTGPMVRLLQQAGGFAVREIDAGCCGMAGSFGYEAEHYALSLEIGEQRLFPALRAARADIDIVAPGVSCRQQIRDATGRTARHFAELLAGDGGSRTGDAS